MYEKAYDRIQSGGTGMRWSGIHYEIMNAVRKYGKNPNGREDAMRALKELLTEFEETHFGSKKQSDEEYISKFDDIDE
jgi:hypothetical protein